MRFHLLDRIDALSDTRIEATKQVSQAEEYLADHFPTFPVLPGVMMLEAATQAAAWLAMHRAGFTGE
ncbi:MAG: beta-hydroxyacyl-ACP dehydratase, partial [Planctomycetota bacterium]